MAIGQLGPFAPKSSSTWTAVLLSDGEIFFGHTKVLASDKIELTNVYYVQKPAGSSTQASNQAPSIVGLVANQIQCPKDDININRITVLYWEDLQESSYVVQRLNALNANAQTCYQPPANGQATSSAAPTAEAPTSAPTATPTEAPTPTPKRTTN